jgi:kynurenine formamidase
MTEYRASFDAEVAFSNGGDLAVHGFRVDVPGPADGPDLAAIPLARTAGLPAVVIRVTGAAWLTGHQPSLVGIDAVNIDDTADRERPAHTLLLAAGIPVIEHLTGLDQLPPAGATFTAVPLPVQGMGTIPVRAFARLPA